MPENPRLSSLGMNGILSKRSGGLSRQSLAWSKVMPGMPAGLKPRALDRGVVHLIFNPKMVIYGKSILRLRKEIAPMNKSVDKINDALGGKSKMKSKKEKREYYREEFSKLSNRRKELEKERERLWKIEGQRDYVEDYKVKNRLLEIQHELQHYYFPFVDMSAIEVKRDNIWLHYEFPLKSVYDFTDPIHSVDKEEKTIIIKIHLDRQNKDIEKDLKSLIRHLREEAKIQGINLKPLRPRWDEYDKYLEILKLKQQGLKGIAIAKKLFSKEVTKTVSPIRHRIGESVSSEAKDAVRKLRKQAEKIAKGEWMKI